VVNKHVLPTVLGDETETFFVLKPLHCTLSHFLINLELFSNVSSRNPRAS
jgi:hypothetical protein